MLSLEFIPNDLWNFRIAEMLIATEICHLRTVSTYFRKILHRFDDYKIAGENNIIRNGLIANQRRECTCPRCGGMFEDLQTHYKKYPYHRCSPYSYNLKRPSKDWATFYLQSVLDVGCLHGSCSCPLNQYGPDLRAFIRPLRLEIVYGSFEIKDISYWLGGLNFGYPHYISNEMLNFTEVGNCPKMRIYNWKGHYWIAFSEQPYSIIRIRKIHFVV